MYSTVAFLTALDGVKVEDKTSNVVSKWNLEINSKLHLDGL